MSQTQFKLAVPNTRIRVEIAKSAEQIAKEKKILAAMEAAKGAKVKCSLFAGPMEPKWVNYWSSRFATQ